MEKLIELLNEFLVQRVSGYIQYHNENGFKRTPTKSAVEGDRMLQDEYVLGKSFGFVKWLVDNDKINLGKAKSGEIMLSRNDDENVIGRLSISDTPIEDLISYLK